MLQLTRDPEGLGRSRWQLEREVPKDARCKYYIQSQNDLYQTSEFVKFAAPWGLGASAVILWGFIATFWCVVGALLGWPVTWAEQRVAGRGMGGLMEMKDGN